MAVELFGEEADKALGFAFGLAGAGGDALQSVPTGHGVAGPSAGHVRRSPQRGEGPDERVELC